jgi:hypothetical protein
LTRTRTTGAWATGHSHAVFRHAGARNSVAASLTPFPSLWINEVQADNLTGITNRAGQHTGWLELYNPSTNVLSLSGLYLANNYTNLLQWAFPTNASINAGQFKVIFADAQTNLSTTNELHTSFILPSGSGSLALTRLATNGQQQVLDYVDYQNIGPTIPTVPSPTAKVSTARNFSGNARRPQQRHGYAAAFVCGLYLARLGLYAEL